MKNRHLFLLAMGLWALCRPVVRGQEAIYAAMPQLSPISPMAAQYMRYGEIPVSLSTGVPEISIPIYTIRANGLEIPINISYHASGIKVKDVSGPVGLGWVLNAGGMIVQQIQGLIDKDKAQSTNIPTFPYLNADEAYDQIEEDRDFLSSDSERWIPRTFAWLLAGHEDESYMDLISDRYSYHFNGNIGTFRWDISKMNPELVMLPRSDLKVEVIPDPGLGSGANGYAHIKITDTEGRIWTFSRIGQSIGESYVVGRLASKEYYLTSIEFPDCEDQVLFEYDRWEAYRIFDMNESVYYGAYGNTYEPWVRLKGDIEEGMLYSDAMSEFSGGRRNRFSRDISPVNNSFSSPFLTRITWKDLTVDFIYPEDPAVGVGQVTLNTDLRTRLSGIRISSEAGSHVINVALTNTAYLGSTDADRRKLLSSIDVNGNVYRFEYNMTPLPPLEEKRDTGGDLARTHRDFWGYYNSVAGTTQIVPFTLHNGAIHEIRYPNGHPYEMTGQYVSTREANPTLTQAGILTKITYPTGGYTEFEYEQNRAMGVYMMTDIIEGYTNFTGRPLSSGPDYFGGVRVKSIRNYTGNGQLAERRDYEYEGGTVIPITTRTLVRQQPIIYWDELLVVDARFLDDRALFQYEAAPWIFSASAINTTTEPGTQSIMYRKVTEYVGGNASVNGKTVYTFHKDEYYPITIFEQLSPLDDSFRDILYSNYHNFDKGFIFHLRDTARTYEYRNGNEILRREEINHYHSLIESAPLYTVGVDIQHKYHYINSTTGLYDVKEHFGDNEDEEYYDAYYDNLRAYHIYGMPGYERLDSVVVRDYVDGGGEVVTVRSYEYDPGLRILSPVRTLVEGSGGELRSETVTHPFDHPEAVYAGMSAAHILSPVIRRISRDESSGTEIQALENGYRELTAGVYVPEVLRTRGSTPGSWDPRVTYHSYDPYNNPTEISKDGTTRVVYIWGYRGERLLAQIENATLSQVQGVIPSAALDSLASRSEPTAHEWSLLGGLRAGLPEALVTTYRYDPLFGLTETTDPRGVITTYGYDSQGRLTQIGRRKDSSSPEEILESYRYHYSNN